MMTSLFDPNKPQQLQMPGGLVYYYPDFIDSTLAAQYYKTLYQDVPWKQDTIKVFGKTYLQPRLTALYGNNNQPYTYSNITMHPLPFSLALSEIKNKVEHIAQTTFTSCLCNLYRDGNDSNGWHADDETSLGKNPIIASVSLGATRSFKFRNKKDHSASIKIDLAAGSLLLMAGATQHNWQHQLPKTRKIIAPRINLTFRIIL